jgi:hypothetical protein
VKALEDIFRRMNTATLNRARYRARIPSLSGKDEAE